MEYPFDTTAISNLCAALRINDISELAVSAVPIQLGDLITKAYYYSFSGKISFFLL